ncbi:MAG: ribosomal protein methyltransferase [Gemmatimonadaceae bacterium]|nr:ribosomal protein methyltransferase [Gemmatimonadaceae bacterium]
MNWIALRITPDSNRDGVIAALFESGSQGVQEDGIAVVTHFPADARLHEIRSAVMAADPRADIAVSEAPETDYSEWRASVSAHHVGNLVIAPPWLATDFDPRTTIVVDPAMAFGTGEHPTTRGVMRLMQGVVRPGDIVADLGAGSAVLSIAAAKLGATRVTAIEIDPDSIGNAEENVRVNGVEDVVEVIEGDATTLLPLLAPVRVVLANIISSVLIPLLPTIRESLAAGGQAILSGILVEERDAMFAALQADGWTAEREDTEDAWWSVQIAPR